MRGTRVLELLRSPWALEPRSFDLMSAIFERWARGEAAPVSTLDQVRADTEDRTRRRGGSGNSAGGVAVIRVYGVICQRGNMLDELSGPGSCSTQLVSQSIREAIADDSVDSILLDVDSPGGAVYGISELADEIFQARSKKPITAVANSLAASAAYWLGSQSTEFYCTQGGEVGSIGVIAAHADYSKQNEMVGVAVTYITAGKYKAEANPNQPLAPEALAYEQSRVDDYYAMFVRAVARGRGKTVADVRGESFGEGRVMGAKASAAAGMIDGIATFDQALARARQLARGPSRSAPSAVIVPSSRAALAAVSRARVNANILASAHGVARADVEPLLADLATAAANLTDLR